KKTLYLCKDRYSREKGAGSVAFFNPDYAVGIVTRVEKPQRNEKLERFCAEGIFVNMLRSKIVKRSLQQGVSGRSRWLLHNLGLIQRKDSRGLRIDHRKNLIHCVPVGTALFLQLLSFSQPAKKVSQLFGIVRSKGKSLSKN
ncbi:MAG: hypothetical protein ACQEQO_08190, partial [Thermodesulfobacteriota bacterium]